LSAIPLVFVRFAVAGPLGLWRLIVRAPVILALPAVHRMAESGSFRPGFARATAIAAAEDY
jgi:hypothetical protein